MRKEGTATVWGEAPKIWGFRGFFLLKPALNICWLGQSTGVDELSINHHAGCRGDPGLGDFRIVGNFFDFDIKTKLGGFGFHHINGLLTAIAARTEDFHMFHENFS